MGQLEQKAAGGVIAGLLGYTPPAGFYSRMQRAVEAMPEVVQTREIPGLLRKYPEGVPKWEISTVDVPSIVGDRKTIGRQELLDAVQQRSPVFTHGEVMLRGDAGNETGPFRLGEGVPSGPTIYEDFGHDGSKYTEILLTQPGVDSYAPMLETGGGKGFKSHWGSGAGYGYDDAVAHARFDVHGDATRVNELQSDLGIHNRKAKEAAQNAQLPEQEPGEDASSYLDRVNSLGYEVMNDGNGGWTWINDPSKQSVDFPLESVWADLLLKRVAMEAARNGTPYLEVASPEAIKRRVGGSLEKYDHFYGNVVPGLIERLGKQMGGIERIPEAAPVHDSYKTGVQERLWSANKTASKAYNDLLSKVMDIGGGTPPAPSEPYLVDSLEDPAESIREWQRHMAQLLIENLKDNYRNAKVDPDRDSRFLQRWVARHMRGSDGVEDLTNAEIASANKKLPELAYLTQRLLEAQDSSHQAGLEYNKAFSPIKDAPPIRYRMSPEMIRNLLERGVPASVLGAAAMQRGDE